ncbi:hypothetical protein CW304_18175 [Bacillus sp. UFRGS-B20]|nr:hypothetical protein CW304_18175 [Bacillus sp. UFRGS-B20]
MWKRLRSAGIFLNNLRYSSSVVGSNTMQFTSAKHRFLTYSCIHGSFCFTSSTICNEVPHE